MYKKFHDVKYPAYDGRDRIPQEETVARAAYNIISENRGSDLLYQYESIYGPAPMPNKSARVESRRAVGPNEDIVTVRGSAAFFQAVEDWIKEEAQE